MKKNVKLELVEHARAVFADLGYRGATVAKICERAGANIAAVNYHFGGKENLFLEVLRNAFAIADQTYPIRGGDTPEERLRTFISAFVQRTYDPGPAGDFNRIMGKILNDPGVPMEKVVREVEVLEIAVLDKVVGELIGRRSVHFKACVAHVMSLCIALVHHPKAANAYLLPKGTSPAQLDVLTERITRFALGGLQAVKKTSAKGVRS